MAIVVHDSQSLLAGVCIFINPSLIPKKDLFDVFHTDVCLLNDFRVFVEAVLLNISFEDIHAWLDFG